MKTNVRSPNADHFPPLDKECYISCLHLSLSKRHCLLASRLMSFTLTEWQKKRQAGISRECILGFEPSTALNFLGGHRVLTADS